MHRTKNQMDDDARLAHCIIEREGRPMLQSEIRERLRMQGRLQTKMQVRATLEVAKAQGLIRRCGENYWEACGATSPPKPMDPPTVSSLALSDTAASELLDLASQLLAVRPCSAVLNDAVRRIFEIALTVSRSNTQPPSVPSITACDTEVAPPIPASVAPSEPTNGAGKNNDDFDFQIFFTPQP